jgi:hypothetical protein
MAENDSFQKIELPLKQTFKGRFNEMAAIGWKMGLDVGHLDGRTHETNRKGSGSVDEFFRNVGTEKTDGNTILGETRSHFRVSTGSEIDELF